MILDKRPQETLCGWTIRAFSDAAERITYAITAKPFGWLDEDRMAPHIAHDQHLSHGSCAICKAAGAPGALRVVVDAVLDAALADPEIAAELREVLAAAKERAEEGAQ